MGKRRTRLAGIGTGRKAGRTNDVSPEAAGRFAELAREMRELIYGEEGYPEWGTKFTEIESQGMHLGLELARLFMEQSVHEQAGRMPEALGMRGGRGQGRPENGRLGDRRRSRMGATPDPPEKIGAGFFSLRAKALGMGIDDPLAPSLQEKVSYLGRFASFPEGETAIRSCWKCRWAGSGSNASPNG